MLIIIIMEAGEREFEEKLLENILRKRGVPENQIPENLEDKKNMVKKKFRKTKIIPYNLFSYDEVEYLKNLSNEQKKDEEELLNKILERLGIKNIPNSRDEKKDK